MTTLTRYLSCCLLTLSVALLQAGLLPGLYAQHRPLIKEWSASYGGSSSDEARAVIVTSDGCYLTGGLAPSSDGQVTDNVPAKKNWLVKTDTKGNVLWKKSYGHQGNGVYSLYATADGGFIAAGGSVPPNSANQYNDFWVLKADANGNTQWEKLFGGTLDDFARSVIQTNDGGYAVAGGALSKDGDITDKPATWNSSYDFWLLKLDASGNKQWAKSYGGSLSDAAWTVKQTPDGGYALAGTSYSIDNGIVGHKGNSSNYWLVKTDAQGNQLWNNSFGSSVGSTLLFSMALAPDGGYVLGGNTNQNGGDVSGVHGNNSQGDFWIVKTSPTGALEWQKCYGGSGYEVPWALIRSRYSGYIVAGQSNSHDGDLPPSNLTDEAWIMAIDDNGNITWSQTLGGNGSDAILGVCENDSGRIVTTGRSSSTNGDIVNNFGGTDYWMMQLRFRIATAPLPKLQYCGSEKLIVKDTLFGTFNADNTFTVQLSDANGSFTNPYNMETFPNSYKDSVLQAIMPWQAPPGTGYRVRVVSSSPQALYADNGQNITLVTGPPPGLGNDTTICHTGSFLLQAPVLPAHQYLWQDNSTGNTYTVTGPGKYYVNITNAIGCVSSDTIVVAYQTTPVFTLGNDTGGCAGSSILLQPSLPMAQYIWNTGSVSPSITATQPGIYWLEVSNGCIKRDSITVSFTPLPLVDLGNDTTLCTGNNLVLTLLNNNAGFLWNDGSTLPQLTIQQAGTYSVKVSAHGCETTDDIRVDYTTLPVIDLGKDTTVCRNFSFVLNAQNNGASYQWTDGSDRSQLTATHEGAYWVDVSNACGLASDTIVISYKDCDCYFSVPSAFSPNGDARNDQFKPMYHSCGVDKYSMRIYNRWGQQVFASRSPAIGWNGELNHQPQPAGTYIYVVQYFDTRAQQAITKRGTLFLIR